jgi:hypothetical protein
MGKQPVLEKDKNGEWVLRLETELSGAWLHTRRTFNISLDANMFPRIACIDCTPSPPGESAESLSCLISRAEDGARRKEWFAEQEEQRVRKVQSVRVSHILVETKEMASSIIDQLRAGEDFSKIAGLISNCEFTREEGGAIGSVSHTTHFP